MPLNSAPEWFACENCYDFVLGGDHIHLTHKLEFDPTFGNFIKRPQHFCCSCFKQVGGVCDES